MSSNIRLQASPNTSDAGAHYQASLHASRFTLHASRLGSQQHSFQDKGCVQACHPGSYKSGCFFAFPANSSRMQQAWLRGGAGRPAARNSLCLRFSSPARFGAEEEPKEGPRPMARMHSAHSAGGTRTSPRTQGGSAEKRRWRRKLRPSALFRCAPRPSPAFPDR